MLKVKNMKRTNIIIYGVCKPSQGSEGGKYKPAFFFVTTGNNTGIHPIEWKKWKFELDSSLVETKNKINIKEIKN